MEAELTSPRLAAVSKMESLEVGVRADGGRRVAAVSVHRGEEHGRDVRCGEQCVCGSESSAAAEDKSGRARLASGDVGKGGAALDGGRRWRFM